MCRRQASPRPTSHRHGPCFGAAISLERSGFPHRGLPRHRPSTAGKIVRTSSGYAFKLTMADARQTAKSVRYLSRSTTGSPKASTLRISRTPKRCSTSWHNRSSDDVTRPSASEQQASISKYVTDNDPLNSRERNLKRFTNGREGNIDYGIKRAD